MFSISEIDFSKPRFFADIKGDIEHLDLKYWGVTETPSIFKGNVEDVIDLPEKKYSINSKAFENINSYKEIL